VINVVKASEIFSRHFHTSLVQDPMVEYAKEINVSNFGCLHFGHFLMKKLS